MRKKYCFWLLTFLLSRTYAQTNTSLPAIIPEPVSVVKAAGIFTLPERIVISAGGAAETGYAVQHLRDKLSRATGRPVALKADTAGSTLVLQLNTQPAAQLGTEGYQLSIQPRQIIIRANKPAGLYYGIQTLWQVFPNDIESSTAAPAGTQWQLPCLDITDYPRLSWRGLMLDVSRHFFTKEEVKRYIDNMVRYKYNVLHWHLTDDEGWRIQIKSYPNLTDKGAWNVKKVGSFGFFTPPAPDEPRTYGGFYTQEDIKEVIQYARERFVDIMPEVDVPGHSLAAIASYPELSCTPGADKYVVRSGEQIMDWSHGAPPIALIDNTLCPANEKVYVFMDKVIEEIAALFPFGYIHLGGDEAPINFWQKTEAIKQLMQRENLKDMHGVQAYFQTRVMKMVEKHGKKMVGWDEIYSAGVPNSAVIMNWRDGEIGVAASQKKYEVILTPSKYAYLDYMQADAITEPPVYAALRLSKTYEFDPVPAGADARYIKGGQGNLWAEQVYNMRQAEYMTWPRGFAIAEALWSPGGRKNWPGFLQRTEAHFKRLDAAQVKYGPGVYDPIFSVSKDSTGNVLVSLSTEIAGLDMYYSFDNSFPDQFYPAYTVPLTVPTDAVMMRVITYRNGKPIGRMQHMPVAELKKRAGLKK